MKEDPPPAGAPKWMATFADMSTLLLTFFVLMLSFANIDVEKFREMLGSVAEAYGVTRKIHGQYQAVLKKDDVLTEKDTPIEETQKASSENKSQTEGDAEEGEEEGEDQEEQEENRKAEERAKQRYKTRQLKKIEEKLEESVSKNNMQDFTEITRGANGIRIRVIGVHMFRPGQAVIKTKINPLLDTVYKGLKVLKYHLVVEGHTDDTPIRHSKLYPSNWELSTARAASVVRYLIEKGIDPKKLSAIGYASNFPIADNDDPDQRNKNRRVEFIFKENQTRAAIDDNEKESGEEKREKEGKEEVTEEL